LNGYEEVTLVEYFFWHSTHIVFVEWFWVIAATVTENGGLCGGDVPIGCVEVEVKNCFSIRTSINYARGVSAKSLVR
jgi:hypothetical protein